MSSGFDARRFFSYLFIFAIALVFILPVVATRADWLALQESAG